MFRRKWFRRSTAISDKGFSVEVMSRRGVVWREGERAILIEGEILVPRGFALYVDGPWHALSGSPPADSGERNRILRDVQDAMDFLGLQYEIRGEPGRQSLL